MAGYPRVIGYVAGSRSRARTHGYVAGPEEDDDYHPGFGVGQDGMAIMQARQPHPHGRSAPWRGMIAPGVHPVQEGHVPLPLNPETFNGTWGLNAGQAPAGTTILFSARPQKPFKTARLIVRGTKVGPTAVGNLVGEVFVGTDLQQGELGNIDLESIGAATAFDTWLSFKQAEPGVWIRVQATLTAFPSGTDFETYLISALGHYLH
jgi:hypothetical protein